MTSWHTLLMAVAVRATNGIPMEQEPVPGVYDWPYAPHMKIFASVYMNKLYNTDVYRIPR